MKVPSAKILEVIREARLAARPVRGVWVRKELERRFGARAGTDRIYRLIQESEQNSSSTSSDTMIADLRQQLNSLISQLDRARERAELSEAREIAHQEKSASEIDALRLKLQTYERGGRFDQLDQQLKLHKELFAARADKLRYEELLRLHNIQY